ncbi:gamma-tubulin complex DGRIP91/SPC98 component [Lactifluus subvellereus]|nr:gamma-tubulin complex DGRIP91/SPC98 component [Lactifluus subvellereus]
MSASSSSLESLIHSIIPQSRNDQVLFNELLAHCTDVLSSHIGQSRERDIGHLADLVKRRLAQSRPDGVSSVQFSNLLSRLLEQPVLSRKYDSILFLHSLASSTRTPLVTPSFLPSLVPSPPISSKQTPAVSPIDAIATVQPQPLKKGKSKAELLRAVRARSGYPHIPELALLRDALYLLQGISGKHVRFATGKDGGTEMSLLFTEDSGYYISTPTKQLVYRLSEVGHLYIRVDHFIREREARSGIGMIEQSLCHHLQSQLTEYYRLIAVLESQLNITNAQDQDTRSSQATMSMEPDVRTEESGLTLRRLDVWVNEWRLRMRMMSVCVEAAKDTHGGALVNLIHSYTENGDPFVRKFTDQLLEEASVSKPFFETLQKWLFSGELYDPYLEFFVTVDPELAHLQYVYPSSLSTGTGIMVGDGGFGGFNVDQDDLPGERESGLRLWQAKYKFRQEMLPAFIFSTGRSLNFIRYSCHDTDWIATREKMSNTNGTLQYSDIFGLERSIDTAYRIASQRLFDIFFDKFRLLDHLRALKNYLLLGHGDFADQLMETIGPSLSKPANSLYRHNLTATLETAIRSSNAQKDPPDVLRRLDARMLEYSQGEIGWDVFTLEYKVDAPLDTVLDPDSMVKYLKLFNHLWKMKRIEGTMTKGWVRTTGATKAFVRLPELESEWHRIRLITAEMIHFIRQMAVYCHLEVIECSWKALVDFINEKEGDLDALINAHRVYLDRMVKKILLIGPKAGREENLLNQVREAFSLILGFYDATEHFYNLCMTESSRRDGERDQTRGIYTTTEKRTSPQQAEALLNGLRQCKEYGTSFSEKVQVILHALQTHADLDYRFLGIRLSFSDFYRAKKDLQKS